MFTAHKFGKLCCLLLVLAGLAAPAGESGWELKIKRNDIQVYQQQQAGFKQKHSQGVMTVDSKLASVFALLADLDACQDWMFACLEASRHSDDYIHMVFDGPMWYKKRDMVIKTEVQLLHSKQWLITTSSHPAVKPDTPHVRVKHTTASWLLTAVDASRTQIIYNLYLDPEVKLKAAVNKYLRDSVYLTLKNMRQQLQLPQYHEVEQLPERIERILLDSLEAQAGAS